MSDSNQQSTYAGRDAMTAGRDIIMSSKKLTWAEKKEAAENLIRGLDSFFYSALSSLGGFATPKNLDSSGHIKSDRLRDVEFAFRGARDRLKSAIQRHGPTLEEEDQKQLHRILDSLLTKKPIDITEALKKETKKIADSFLLKYLEN